MQHTGESHRPHPRLHLAEVRTQRSWSQQDVAERIGTTAINVSRWERGLTRPGPYFRSRLCQLFGKSEQELDLASTPTPHMVFPADRLTPDTLYDPAIPLQPAQPLIGRDKELEHLKKRLLSSGSVALTALNGLPGVGKTALAIALVHNPDIQAHFRDGILWAALGTDPKLMGILARWGTLLGISATEMANLSDSEAWTLALRLAIGTRRVLLVIDDAWRVEDVLSLKIAGPYCGFVVTTRIPKVATATALDGMLTIQELSEDQSMHLLRELAPLVVEREEQQALALVKAVGGLPLALTLIGNYLRMQSYGGQTRRISAALKRLSAVEERLVLSEPRAPIEFPPSLSLDTPLSLQSVISITDQQLDKQARAALYALSVFPPKPNSFSEEAALAIADCDANILDTLFDAGLLESSSSSRYCMHQTIADYGRLRLQDGTAFDRLIAFYTDFAESYTKDYAALELESGIILSTLEQAHTLKSWPALVRCTCAFAPFLISRGMYAVAEQCLQVAYDAAQYLGDGHRMTTTLLYLGEIAQYQGNYSRAESCLQEGLALARSLEDTERISALLNNLGWVMWKSGAYAQAEAYLQEGLMLARQVEDQERISSLLKVLGSVADSRGDYAQAEIYLQEGLALARLTGNRELICELLINLGATVVEQGNYSQAEEYFREGLVLARQIGHRELISLLLSNLGASVVEQRNYSKAQAYFQEGLTVARQIGHREWTSLLLINLGMTARRQREYDRAAEYLHEGLAVAQSIGNPMIISIAFNEYGDLYLDQKQIKKAEGSFREMLSNIPEGNQELLALAHYGLARTAAAQGSVEDARSLGEASISVLESIGHRNAQEVREWLNSMVN